MHIKMWPSTPTSHTLHIIMPHDVNHLCLVPLCKQFFMVPSILYTVIVTYKSSYDTKNIGTTSSSFNWWPRICLEPTLFANNSIQNPAMISHSSNLLLLNTRVRLGAGLHNSIKHHIKDTKKAFIQNMGHYTKPHKTKNISHDPEGAEEKLFHEIQDQPPWSTIQDWIWSHKQSLIIIRMTTPNPRFKTLFIYKKGLN